MENEQITNDAHRQYDNIKDNFTNSAYIVINFKLVIKLIRALLHLLLHGS